MYKDTREHEWWKRQEGINIFHMTQPGRSVNEW
jgi:hypothetical protein